MRTNRADRRFIPHSSSARRAWTPAAPPRAERFAVRDEASERARWTKEAVEAGCRTVEAVAAYVGAASPFGCDVARAEEALQRLVKRGEVVWGPGGYGSVK